MKIGRIVNGSGSCLSIQTNGSWFNFTTAHQALQQEASAEPIRQIESLLEAGLLDTGRLNEIVYRMNERGLLEEHKLNSPPQFALPLRPGKIVALGFNYMSHAQEIGFTPPSEPIIFSKSVTSCIADGEPIIIQPWYSRVDHEVELAVLIGRRAKNLKPEQAQDVIAGYTILNDVTERDIQKKDIGQGHPWFRSKSLDTFGPLGPVIVLPDEFPWPAIADVELRVNGEVRQQSTTARFLFPIPEVLAFITRFMTLEPGDIVSTGTPEGISPLYPGDQVEAYIPDIGTLCNPVVAA